MEASWLTTKLAQTDTTIAVVLTKAEIKQGALPFLGHLPTSKDFRQDLNLSNTYWFYHPETLKRCLLL